MGVNQSINIDFRSIVNEVKYGDDLTLIDLNESPTTRPPAPPATASMTKAAAALFAKNKPYWKTLFLTVLSDDDISAFFNFDDIRFLRLHRPNQLAIVLFKCIEQLVLFEQYHERISDYTAVENALRIITNAMPYIRENISLIEGSKLNPSTFIGGEYKSAEAKYSVQKSVFSEDFFEHLFLFNRCCVGNDIVNCENFPSFPGYEGACLSTVLCRVLTRLCFIPSFSIGVSRRRKLDPSSNDRVPLCEGSNVFIESEKLWFGGAFVNPESAPNKVGSTEIAHRVLLLKAILTIFVGPVVNGIVENAPEHLTRLSSNTVSNLPKSLDHLQGIFFDPIQNEMGPTLCASLINCISNHSSRGLLPYTSYIGADIPELLLSLSVQVLCVALNSCHSNGTDPYNEGTTQNYYWDVIESLPRKLAYHFLLSIQRVVGNPLYASSRWLKGSQKSVICFSEAIHLIYLLSNSSYMMSVLFEGGTDEELPSPNTTLPHQVLETFIFFIVSGSSNFLYFNLVQIIVWTIHRWFNHECFIKFIKRRRESIRMTHVSFAEGNCYGDVLILTMCYILSVAVPRWYFGLSPSTSIVLENLCTVLRAWPKDTALYTSVIYEGAQLELKHTLDFVCSTNFLRKGEAARVAAVTVCRSVLVAVAYIGEDPSAAVPVAASLGACTSISNICESFGILIPKEDKNKEASKTFSVPTTEEMNAAEDEVSQEISETDKDINKHASRILFNPSEEEKLTLSQLYDFCSQMHKALNSALENMTYEGDAFINEDTLRRAFPAIERALVEIHDREPANIPNSGALMGYNIHSLSVSHEMHVWQLCAVWEVIQKHNSRTIFFDKSTAMLYVDLGKQKQRMLERLSRQRMGGGGDRE